MKFRKFFLFFIVMFSVFPVFAQKQLSVQVNDSVYQLLENAQLRGIIPLLPAAKPYTREFVCDKLNEVLDSGKLSKDEIAVFLEARERIWPSEKKKWYLTGSYTTRFDPEINKGFPITVGANWESKLNLNCNDPYPTNQHWLNIYLEGAIKEHFSYKIDASGGLIMLSQNSFAPNTFTRTWDGFQYAFNDFYKYDPVVEKTITAGTVMLPEICYSNWDNKFGVKFSRTRHQWGYASGSLFFSDTAQPMLGVETWIYPVKWFQTNLFFGTTEYVSNGDLQKSASPFQNMYTAVQGQFNILDYAYFGALGTLVWAKRFELGYMYPFLFPFLYQNQIGDFDNMQVGLYFGATIPKATHIYGQIFIDECNLTSKPFFNLSRNMFSYLIGAKTPLPFWTSTLITQYTKIEPFMYTHPNTKTPYYAGDINTSYINHGEGIGYNLQPNSDEIRLQLQSNPLWYLTTNIGYTMVRHGLVEGSSINDQMDYDELGKELDRGIKPGDRYWKDFLHDGVYEWIHSFTLSATLNCRKWNVPIDLSLAYTFSYTLYSLGNVFTRDITYFYEDDIYKNKMGNYLTIAVKIYK